MYNTEVPVEPEEKKMNKTNTSQFSIAPSEEVVVEKDPRDKLLVGGRGAVIKKLHKVNHDAIFSKDFQLKQIDPELENMEPK
jgi:hypothetical protein